jgi:regulator of sirC expression with transglutaminase-like and TPR domain
VGNATDYYNPRNSYLPLVLKTREGLPITLTLVYKCVLDGLGLTVHGINAPGHFMAGVESADADGAEPARMLVDPFEGGC